MTSEFEEIYSRFYLRITDYGLAGLDEKLANEMLYGYMLEVISDPYFFKLFQNIEVDEDLEELTYSLNNSIGDTSDKMFVEKVIATGMIPIWLEHRHYTSLHYDMIFTNSEQRFYSQAAHIQAVQAAYSKAQIDYRKLIRDYGYSYSVINGV